MHLEIKVNVELCNTTMSWLTFEYSQTTAPPGRTDGGHHAPDIQFSVQHLHWAKAVPRVTAPHRKHPTFNCCDASLVAPCEDKRPISVEELRNGGAPKLILMNQYWHQMKNNANSYNKWNSTV